MSQLRLVLNGSFRSGTSILWNVLKKSNPEVYCFYEPCHPGISDLLRSHPMGTVNELHDEVLFDEYHLAFKDAAEVFEDSLSRTKVYPDNFEQVRNRISGFINLDKDSILQSNRWHFHLERIHETYGCPIMHVIRNPLRVWNSVQRGIREQGRWTYELRRILWNRSLGDFFGSNSIYYTSKKRHPHKEPKLSTSQERFIAGWTISNYYAMKAVHATNGTFLSYESLLTSGGDILDQLSIPKVRFERHAAVRRNEMNFLSNQEQMHILHVCKRFGLDALLDAILDSIED